MLTVNIGAAAPERAAALLRWLDGRDEDVLVLSETSNGDGTRFLLDHLRRRGFTVLHTADPNGDRGVAVASRVPITERIQAFNSVTIPGRIVAVTLDTTPAIGVLGIYVPSRDRSLLKTEKKQAFISSLLADLDRLPWTVRETLVIGGDYNVISRTHKPLHPGFLPFEFGLLEALEAHGFIDAHEPSSAGEQAYSWIGRSGDGYRYDYFHVGRALSTLLAGSAYLHETRTSRLTDHAAVAVSLNVQARSRQSTAGFVREEAIPLF